MKKCILIKTNLEFKVVELPDDDGFNDEVYKLLNCKCWEGVPGYFGTYLMVDESGKINSPPKEINLLANVLYAPYLFGEDVLCGDVLVSTIGLNEQDETDLVSLSDRKLAKLLDVLGSAQAKIKEVLKD